MRNFLGFGQVAYVGSQNVVPIKLGGILGNSVPLSFTWLDYGAGAAPNLNVAVDLSGQSISAGLKQIRSIYIDNMGSDTPIYVQFPDTLYTIVAKPNSAGWFPCYTNGLKFIVVGLGFVIGAIPQTYILVTNLSIDPSVDIELDQAVALWKATRTTSGTSTIYTRNLGTPALGDNTSTSTLDLSIPGDMRTLFFTPQPGFFIYITALQLNLIGALASLAGNSLGIFIESTGISGTLYQVDARVSNVAPVTIAGLLNQSGLQTKLDGSQTWRIRYTSSTLFVTGEVQLFSQFTIAPT